MVKAYLDSYRKITIYVSKNYYDGKLKSFYFLTNYGPVKLPEIELIGNNSNYNIYEINLEEDVNVGEEYYLVNEYGYKVLLEYRYITKTEKFMNDTYTNEYLGCEYNQGYSEFSLWAPISNEVILVLNDVYYNMIKVGNVFKLRVEGDLNKANYYFLVKVNGKFSKVLDPYSYSYNIDQSASVVVNLKGVIKGEKITLGKKSKVIYETNVRDFSSLKNIKHKGKFLGVVEEESLEHLNNLGIEYLQLMPINYFNGDVYNNESFYNWGYNPYLFGVPHPNYVYGIEDGYCVINECKEMINKLHQNGIKVVIDVVFNHLENREDNILNLIVPYYYYLMEDNKISNGSFCGVDLDSRAPMMKRLIKDMCMRWVKLYGVDGFRFDLMGILDYRTINEIYDDLKSIKENVIVYGEGWNMPSIMEDDEKAILLNANKMPNIAFFNDYYREGLKYDYLAEDIINGNYINNNQKIFEANQSINYLECHDNYTYYDVQKYVELRDEKFIIKKQLFKNLVILLTKGYAFYHSGQEFFRTKKGVENSYCSLDDVNGFDWNRLYKYSKEVNLVEKMTRIREKHGLFMANYKYENKNNVIYITTNGLEIVMNLSDKVVNVDEDKEVILSTSKTQLEKYDLVVYKS